MLDKIVVHGARANNLRNIVREIGDRNALQILLHEMFEEIHVLVGQVKLQPAGTVLDLAV